MKRLLFIYNPHAGKELLKPKLADVIDIFVKAGYEVVAYPTQAYRDAYKKINAKSIMGMMSLKLQKGEDVTIIADGQDEDAAVSGVATFLGAQK